MITIQKIREDLKEIRYYYAKQKELDGMTGVVGHNLVLDKVHHYNKAISTAPIRLYDTYVSLYVNNNTHEALAYDWDVSTDYIKQLTKQLHSYLLAYFQSEEGLSE